MTLLAAMLNRYPSSARDAVWIDLLDPSDAERAEAEQIAGLRLPTRAEIDEIEWSSRVFVEGGALYLSTPILDVIDPMRATLTTIGFVLSSERLVTVRFANIAAFDRLLQSHASPPTTPRPRDLFLEILESFVDHAADSFERASAELERISRAAFRSERPRPSRLAHTSQALHGALLELGRMGEGISHVRDTLIGVDRITLFVLDTDGRQALTGGPRPGTALGREAWVDASKQLQSIRADVASLEDFQKHLEGKVQFLLDATLGFISIQQNEIVKTLTIASVVGVPPVLIAGIYGMNFRFMPELGWAFGYPLALLSIVVSALVPIVWFKRRGWM